MHVNYEAQGICAVKIEFDLEDDIIKNVQFHGGCDGNHKGLSKLVEGMPANEVVNRLSGLTCGRRNSSCPDQLAAAIVSSLKK